MAMPEGWTKLSLEQVADALRKSAGIVSPACEALGIDRGTYYSYERKWPELLAIRAEAKERLLDLSETKLITAIQGGDVNAIKFHLKCHGKQRGWIESVQVQGTAPGGAIPVAHVDMSKDDLLEYAKQLAQEI